MLNSACRLPARLSGLTLFLSLLLLAVLGSAGSLLAREDSGRTPRADESVTVVTPPAEPTTALERFTRDVTYMASDELGGRDTFSPGAELTAQFIIEDFQKYGIKSALADGSFRQPFQIEMGRSLNSATAYLGFWNPETQLTMELDKHYKPQLVGGSGTVAGELVFVGYGIDDPENNFREYEGVDVSGKVVLMLRRQPMFEVEDSPYSGSDVVEQAYIRSKVAAAQERGAVGIVFVNDIRTATSGEESTLENSAAFGDRELGLPFVLISQAACNQLLAAFPLKDADGQPISDLMAASKAIDSSAAPLSQAMTGVSAKYSASFEDQKGWGYNIVGVIEGEGPLANETIVIGGHYDHIGIGSFGSRAPGRFGEVHNGADDNATGTAAVMELARRYAQADRKPARRLVFIAFSAEERGLLGAYHYVENPLYPLATTVAMINFDMIGWLRNDKLTIYGTGTSSVFDPVAEQANTDAQLQLDKIAAGFAGSDHLPFQQKGVPAVFFHTGLTPTYHTPDDTTESIDMAGAVRVIDYTEKFIDQLLLTEKIEFQATGGARRSRPAYLGAQMDFENITEQGLTIREVTEDSPAAQAGLKPGDIIAQMDDKSIRSREDMTAFLSDKQPADKVTIKIIRDGQEESLEVILGQGGRRRQRDNS